MSEAMPLAMCTVHHQTVHRLQSWDECGVKGGELTT